MSIFTERLKEALQKRDMRKAELAIKSGISRAQITNYASGVYVPKSKNIAKMARVLHVSEKWLMGEDVPMESYSAEKKLDGEALKFALFNSSEGITDEMLDEVKAFAEYVKRKNS